MAAQRINSPFATPERSADVLGVPKARASRLIKLARSSAARTNPEGSGGSPAPNNEKGIKKATK
jgi:hypothetical protein